MKDLRVRELFVCLSVCVCVCVCMHCVYVCMRALCRPQANEVTDDITSVFLVIPSLQHDHVRAMSQQQ